MNFLKSHPHLDLSGPWSFAFAPHPVADYERMDAVRSAGMTLHPCTVPGNFELDLHAIGAIPEPFYGMNIVEVTKFEHHHVWYGRTFQAEPRDGFTAELVFEGLDCYADVFLNGERIGSCDNMLVEHVFDVTGRLRGENELLVHIKPAVLEAKRHGYSRGTAAFAVNYESLHVRKAPHMYGWDIMPRAVSAGIWRPVKLRHRPCERLQDVYLETLSISPDRRRADLLLNYRAQTFGTAGDVYELEVAGRCGDSTFEQKARLRFDAGRLAFNVDDPRLWWPRGYGEANVYDVSLSLLKNGAEIDRFDFILGIRTVELVRTSVTTAKGEGEFVFKVNGEKIFAKGSNWVPMDAFHSRDAARIPAAVALAVEANCNIIRCWGGNVYENDLFFDLCDRAGIMIWQDFAMACAIYPHDADFQQRLAAEARAVVRRLRQHPCIVLWAGDNECDWCHYWLAMGDPNRNVLTRQVLPAVLHDEDPLRPYLPSSPCIDEEAHRAGTDFLPENHLWGPRNYYKSEFYLGSLCHFVSEIGYHGCPEPESLRKFISPGKLWPYQNNEEWILHCTSPVPGLNIADYRVELMANQIRVLFGGVPDVLDGFAFASQAVQAEAKKFFIEFFRGSKWRRTGIIWWNLIDGWPQFSDAVVDYYYAKKLAFEFIKRCQQDLLVLIREPAGAVQQVVAANDTLQPFELEYLVKDADTAEVLAGGHAIAAANAVTPLAEIPFDPERQRFYVITRAGPAGAGVNHYLAGKPPFDLEQYRKWLAAAYRG
ncbi:MAG TPA: glycoside hydrolase family 2 [Planctomycetota bacterium]|nr:glycoside hydrolase family 2 [Planctomycetota bacterium]